MKAIQITKFVDSFSELGVREIPPPRPDADHEVVVKISHSALNHVDLLYARGRHQNNHIGLVKPPFVLGLEFAGVVVSAPLKSASTSKSGFNFKPGDKVWGASVGGFAEQIAVPASALQRLPTGWTLHDAAGLGAATAPVSYGALVRVAQLQAGQTVLVHAAAGGLGVVAVQIAHALGANVIATVGSDEKAQVVRQLGVLAVVRYDLDGWEKQVWDITGRTGVHVVYDTVGLVEKSLRCLTFGGCIVVAGFAGRGGNMETLAMNRVLLKGARLLGYRYGETGRQNPEENEAVWKGLNDLLETGRVRPIVYKTYLGLESVPGAMDDLAARKVWGKAIVEIRSPTPNL
ncbi:hypothetical protein A1O3_01032 [Capronia epimyces CBS 606.96]|uniref:Enoyl reductase (ER) domain-containing protein n=1 Tax=Capronia epimyces CBS 606.96 TaxID=1182542 RepID=W9YS47_9EURO|nr:uncharacterized protein A1O3_01032 [Capronia epimyces CBS 606.96]EXJ92480.1 hypothetical protein A1O3_01032 [Capronia epimyces CBS 606.96]